MNFSITFFLIFILSGCSSKKEEKKDVYVQSDKYSSVADSITESLPPKEAAFEKNLQSDSLKSDTGRYITTTYYPNGKTQARISFYKGVKDGESVYYYPDGSLKLKILMDMGKRKYLSKYDIDGSLLIEEFYKEEKVVDSKAY